MKLFITSILAFVSTNIDDIFILTLLFGSKNFRAIDIYLGQYLGISLLIVVSLVGAFAGNFVDASYIGLMGLFPIYLGIKQLIALRKGKEEDSNEVERNLSTGFFAIAMITFANGGDNIGTYIPLFVTMSATHLVIMIAIFLILVFLWLRLARYFTHHELLAKTILNFGHIVTPIVLCLLGIYILYQNGSFELLGL